jgi:lipopolysaccharide/colanic/teichoic acid biosynthesis glycosyltransferase
MIMMESLGQTVFEANSVGRAGKPFGIREMRSIHHIKDKAKLFMHEYPKYENRKYRNMKRHHK